MDVNIGHQGLNLLTVSFCRDASVKERQTGENIVFRPQNVSEVHTHF